jgi:glucose/mannose transport system substrate-binding protein
MTVHAQRFPRDFIINAKTGHVGRAHRTTRMRFQNGEPMDVLQSIIGHDLMQWVLPDGVDDRDALMVPLDDVMADDVADWRRVMPPEVLPYVSYRGKMYGVPATVHRVNTVYYNRRLLMAHGLEPPRSVAELRAVGDVLRAHGTPLFALDAKEPWPLGHLVFEGLLIAREGPEFYGRYFTGKERPDDPRIIATLEEGLALLGYGDPKNAQLSEPQGADLVAKGEAAAIVTGDWVGVYFNPAGLGPDDPVVEAPFPGTEKTFVYTADVFSLPVGAKNPGGAKRLLSTIGSAQGQRVLSKVKGCLSPRSDVHVNEVTETQRQKAALLRGGGALVLALPVLVPAQFHEDLNQALLEMMQQHDIDPVVHTLVTRYDLLVNRSLR